MQATWDISETQIEAWRALVEANKHKKVPRARYEMNVRRRGIDLSKEVVWRRLIGCQVTTQQRSGPRTPVSRFLNSDSPLLNLAKAGRARSVTALAEAELSSAGLHMGKRIGERVGLIFNRLHHQGEWSVLLEQLESLRKPAHKLKERAVADYLCGSNGNSEKLYPGLGPKQSRNFIQWLGLSRHEVPLDSRVLKTLRELGATFVPKGNALSDQTVYLFVQELIQRIARQIDVYPCMLDACIFASVDDADDGALEDED